MTETNPSDFVTRALDSLRDHPLPDGPSLDLLEMTANRLHTATVQRQVLLASRRRELFRLERFAGIATICTLLVIGAVWIGPINPSAGMAFADVQQQVRKVRTAQYVNTRLTEGASDSNDDMNQLLVAGKSFRVTGDAHQPRIVRTQGRYLQRTETLNSQGEIASIQISDFEHGKHVTLFPKERRFVSLETQVTIDLASGKQADAKIKPAPEVDLCQIGEVPPQATIRLPARTLGGKQVIGFYWEQKISTQKNTTTWERTYWVDPATKLPVRIEVCHYSTDKHVASSEWVQSGFEFNVEFPVDLFSTEPPKGYQRHTEKITGLKHE